MRTASNAWWNRGIPLLVLVVGALAVWLNLPLAAPEYPFDRSRWKATEEAHGTPYHGLRLHFHRQRLEITCGTSTTRHGVQITVDARDGAVAQGPSFRITPVHPLLGSGFSFRIGPTTPTGTTLVLADRSKIPLYQDFD